ncbi:hypothetical protein [Streptomyces sp. TRM49041]|uniref:hypothetical protein n=1 Tax=Streptomyces sp. TRM49041 TaxID=2603216 RepID=UPI0011EF1F6E|nr:hypothetical protein [Streptomyces sp. TRM49041]
MEGLRLIRIARRARVTRPMALLGAVATLLAALFICFGPARHADRVDADRRVAAVRAVADPTSPFGAVVSPSHASCPYDDRECGLFPSLTPAVLTVPPLDPPLYADGLAPFGPAPDVARPDGVQALPRAPDLHVLQVLRT